MTVPVGGKFPWASRDYSPEPASTPGCHFGHSNNSKLVAKESLLEISQNRVHPD